MLSDRDQVIEPGTLHCFAAAQGSALPHHPLGHASGPGFFETTHHPCDIGR
jgi:hypothetical protein